jgi:hypothetical protein
MLKFLVPFAFILLFDTSWLDKEREKFLRDLQIAAGDPIQGEPVSASVLRHELNEAWKKALAVPKFDLD